MAIDIGDMIVSPWQNKEKDEWDGLKLNPKPHSSPTWTTKTGVDRQDYYTLEDFAADPSLKDNMDVKAMLGNTGLQLLQNSYAKKIVNELLDAGENGSWRPKDTVKESDDHISKGIKKLKDKKYKLIKMHSKLGQYNSLLNLAGTAAGMFVGTLGLGGMAIVNDLGGVALSSLPTGMLALSGLQALYKGAQALKRKGEGVVQTALPPSGKEIISLAIANYYSILLSKPGLLVKSWRKNSEDAFTNTSLNKFVPKLRTEKELVNNESFLNYDKNYKEYITGDYSPFDEIVKKEVSEKDPYADDEEEPIIENEVREIAIAPSKNNQEKELNNSSEKILLKDISIDVVNDQDYHYLSEEELDLFKEHYAYFGESDGVYTTGSYKTASGKISSYQRLKEIGEDDQRYLNEKREPYKSYIQEPRRKETIINATVGNSFKTAEVYNYKINELLYKYNKNGKKEDFVNKCLERINQTYYKIGCLHILPFYSSSGTLQTFDIPFEFNPVINEGASTATYQEENLLGRIIPIKSYTKTAPGDITLELTYMALSPDEAKTDEEKEKDFKTSNNLTWMNTWTPKHLEEIEKQLRSLTLPYIEESDFVRPPVVSIILSNSDAKDASVSELFTYPTTNGKLQITEKLKNGESIRYKRYVVKSVNISPLNNNFGNSYIYNSNVIKRYGFKVSLSLSETTINFLDLIPSYKQYVGKTPEAQIDKKPETWNWTSVVEEPLDLWTCLNEPSSVGFSHINIRQDLSDAPFPPFMGDDYEDLIIVPKLKKLLPELFKDDEISLTDEEQTLLNVDDRSNKRKSFDTYKKQLLASPSIGGDVGKLIELFKDSEYWNRNNKYINWLYGVGEKTSYDDFDKDWENYIASLNKIYPEDGFERFAKYANKTRWLSDAAKYITESPYRINVLYDNGFKANEIFDLLDKAGMEDNAKKIKTLKNTYFFAEDKANSGGFLSWLKNEKGAYTKYKEKFEDYYNDLIKAGFNNNDIYYFLSDSKWKDDCEKKCSDVSGLIGSSDEKREKVIQLLRVISFDKWIELYEKYQATDKGLVEYLTTIIDLLIQVPEQATLFGKEIEGTVKLNISKENYEQFLKWIGEKLKDREDEIKNSVKDKLIEKFDKCYNTVFKHLKQFTELDWVVQKIEENEEDKNYGNYKIWFSNETYNPPWCKMSYGKPIEEEEDNSDLPTQAELYNKQDINSDDNSLLIDMTDAIFVINNSDNNKTLFLNKNEKEENKTEGENK